MVFKTIFATMLSEVIVATMRTKVIVATMCSDNGMNDMTEKGGKPMN
jgi:hypothetical protein